MRAVLLVVTLAALGCGGRASTGPAWPKSAGTEIDPDAEDGGESIDPRESESSVASVESSEAEPVTPAVSEGEKPKLVPDAAKPDTPTPPTSSTPDEPPTEGEIVIEIND